ncbi:type I-B CRISPR-associated endonuclease Cas1b [Thermosipho atlanticus]|uniref:CRISPR-associated endonuclease Cas1 n=1 Tax=Thermosipho atlanticus DSM 15807 TaxID=1123380 RepID=A0A1M5U3S2_9BACT|nr:type I-B CRISPR-associated endonuclease Cas1b [Thermosipho atlanticus]SHH57672.1 CRISPR-associated protein, Cas1 family [Thermosipho atlanticus DSM 15807]
MKKSFYLFSSGKLRRKDNSLIFESKNKSYIPIENVYDIFVFGELEINSKLIDFLSQNGIPIHFFNYYGFYSGSFYPREKYVSGNLLVKQVEHYINSQKRIEIAKELVDSAAYNMFRNLRYYNSRKKGLKEFLLEIENFRNKISFQKNIQALMGIEGNIRETYYKSWEKITKYTFEKRVKRPPSNLVNTLISFLNSIMYTTTLTEIYKTYLNPTISYLHEPGKKRFSLSLDISEVFKPLIVDRLIFTLLNKNIITEKDLKKELDYTHIKEDAKKTIVRMYDERLKNKVYHKTLKKNVSYKQLIRLECYKLVKHLLEEKKYEAFKLWW